MDKNQQCTQLVYTYFMRFKYFKCIELAASLLRLIGQIIYEGEPVIIRSAVAFVFLLAALSFSRASLGVIFFLSQLCRFEVAQSVPLSQP